MTLRVVGCTHQQASLAMREQLAFSAEQAGEALSAWKQRFPDTEAVLLSTCNRVEFYAASALPDRTITHDQLVEFLADSHRLPVASVANDLFDQSGEDAVRHLFSVAASLESMVVGEPQILSQVKEAYALAMRQRSTGPLTHTAFQTAVKVARRVMGETNLHQRRVSIPSVAVTDFASRIFDRFDDKQILLVGAGEMAAETLRYLRECGGRHIRIVNRSQQHAAELAAQFDGRAEPWDRLASALVAADLVICTTGATEPVITASWYEEQIDPHRYQRPLFVLDLATPRDVEPAVGSFLGVYLYSLDDLAEVCDRNRREREKELPAARRIIEEETVQFMADWHHRATGPTIARLRQLWQIPKDEELNRLFHKLPDVGDRQRDEIEQFADRLINKLLHPPLESLRDEAREDPPHGLLEALKRLFQLDD